MDGGTIRKFNIPYIVQYVGLPPHLGVERRAHDVVVVTGQHRNARAALPVPDADRLRSASQDSK